MTLGGLGIRSAVEVAPSAFLSSVHSSSELVKAILPPSFSCLPSPLTVEAQTCWSVGHDHQPPEGATASKQKSWDGVRAASVAERLLECAENDEERARLLSVSTKESGAWLRALPVTALGLRMDDHTVRVAVRLRLGTAVCGPHSCQLCGTAVDSLGRHALSCRRSKGRHQRHAALNDIIKRGLSAAHVPSRLEPVGLSRSDGKRPDGVILAPWKSDGLGCHLSGHFCPFLQGTCHPRTREVTEAAEDRSTWASHQVISSRL